MHPSISASTDQLLQLAQQAEQRGDRQTAHELCVQLTHVDPTSESAWLQRASSAESMDETIAAVSTALAQNPTNAAARRALHYLMNLRLRRDAFVRYIAESDQSYHIQLLPDLDLEHPKDRALSEPFPPIRPALLAAALRWLGWSIVGLIPSGLGTLICAPIAMLNALRILRGRPNSADRQRALIVLAFAGGLWLIAVILVLVLVLHLS